MNFAKIFKRLANYILMTILALIFISPVLFMIVGSFKPDAKVMTEAGSVKAFFPDEAGVQNYRDVFERTAFGRYLFNSVWINTLIVGLGLLINSMAAYSLSRLRWKGRKFFLNFVLVVMVIPFEAIAVPLFFQVTVLGWRDVYSVQIFPFVAYPLSIYLFYSFFLGMPRELEEAAKIDGAGHFGIFFRIIVPNAKPAFASVAIVTLLLFWGMYLWPLLVTTGKSVRPLPLAIATFFTLPPLQWGDILAFGVMMVAPILVVFLLFQRWFVKGVATTGMKG